MATTRDEISAWFDRGLNGGWGLQDGRCTHMIVFVDEFDWEDYPVYVGEDEDVNEVLDAAQTKPMQRVTEVYNLSMDKEAQINEPRAFNI